MRVVVVVLTGALVAATLVGCGDDASSDADPPTSRPGPSRDGPAPAEPGGDLVWEACGENLECASLAVPVDHADADGATLDLALARHPASGERRGALLVNPGGPGGSGVELAAAAVFAFPDEVLEHFDVVGWDPRGVAASAPARCLDDAESEAFWSVDRTPDDAAEVADNVDAGRRFADACREALGGLLPHLSSTATVHDMDRIRAALGEEQLSYLGFSYGTYLGARYAEEYPDRVRALVLDGAVDPSLTLEEANTQQSVGFDQALESFLADCADAGCAFAGRSPPGVAYDRLVAQIDRAPIPASDGRALGPGEADIGVARALYGGREAWPALADALAAAEDGDGAPLLALADDYAGRRPDGTYDGSSDAFYAISCLDGPALPGVDAVERLADDVAAAAPRFGPAGVWLSVPCTFWPAAPDAKPAPIAAPGTPPILVLGTSGDPATPEAWAAGLAEQLDSGVLVVLDDEGHTASGRGNDCIDTLVTRYLVELEAPAPQRCAAG